MNLERLFEDLVRLPAMTADQACRHYGFELAELKQALRSPRMKGLVKISTELIRDRAVPGPITIVKKGIVSARTAGEIAYEAEKRWSKSFSPKLVIQATGSLCALYGNEVKHVAAASLSHDIGLVEALLNKRQEFPSFEWSLVSMRPGGGAQADAASISGELLIELVGRYAGKLVAAKLELAAASTIEFW